MIKNPLVERACVQILSHTEMSLGSLYNTIERKLESRNNKASKTAVTSVKIESINANACTVSRDARKSDRYARNVELPSEDHYLLDD